MKVHGSPSRLAPAVAEVPPNANYVQQLNVQLAELLDRKNVENSLLKSKFELLYESNRELAQMNKMMHSNMYEELNEHEQKDQKIEWLQAKCSALEGEVRQIAEIEQQMNVHFENIDRMEAKAKQYEGETKRMREALQEAEAELQKMRTTLQQRDEEIRKLETFKLESLQDTRKLQDIILQKQRVIQQKGGGGAQTVSLGGEEESVQGQEQLQTKCLRLEAEIQRLRSILDMREHVIESERNERLQHTLRKLEMENEVLRVQVAEIEAYSNANAERVAIVERLEDRNMQLQNEIEQLHRQQLAKLQEDGALRGELLERSQEIAALKGSQIALSNSYEETSAQYHSKVQRLDQLFNEVRLKEQDLLEELRQKETIIDQLMQGAELSEKRLRTLESDKRQLQNNIETLTKEKQQLLLSIQAQDSDVQRHIKRLQSVESEYEARLLREREEQRHVFEQEKSQLLEDYERCNERLRETSAKVTKLQEQMHAIAAALTRKEEDQLQLAQQVDSMQTSRAEELKYQYSLEDHVKNLEEKFTQFKQMKMKYENKISQLIKQNSDLRQQLELDNN